MRRKFKQKRQPDSSKNSYPSYFKKINEERDKITHQGLIDACLQDMPEILSNKNASLKECDQFEFKVILFSADMLRIIRSKQSSLDVLLLVSGISFLLYCIGRRATKDLAYQVKSFLLTAKENIPECRNATLKNLLPWITLNKKLTKKLTSLLSVVNFLETTNLQSFIKSLLREYIEQSKQIELSVSNVYINYNPYHLFLRDEFIPQLFLLADTPKLNKLEIYWKLINLYMKFSIPVKGSARRYFKKVNHLLITNLNALNINEIMLALTLNNKIFKKYRMILLNQKDREAILRRIFSSHLDNAQLSLLFEMRWTILKDLPADVLEKFDDSMESKNKLLQKYSFPWSLKTVLNSSESMSNTCLDQERALPFIDPLKEKAVRKGVSDLKSSQRVSGEFTEMRVGALLLCSRIMFEMAHEKTTNDSLMNLALVTTVLRALDNTDTDSELEYTFNLLMGAFIHWGWFMKYSMNEYRYVSTNNVLHIAMLDSNITRRLGFSKSTNLHRYGQSVVLSKMLASTCVLTGMAELKDDRILQRMPVALYSHLSNDFVPKIFSSLQASVSLKEIELAITLIKLVLIYPINLQTPQCVWFVKKLITDNLSVSKLACLSESQLCEILKLCEFYEAKYQKPFLSPKKKYDVLNHMLSTLPSNSWRMNGNLIRFKSTIFNVFPKTVFVNVEMEFDAYVKSRTTASEKVVKRELHSHEKELASAIRDALPFGEQQYLLENYICPETGREIDIVFIKGNLKLAIHIDGTLFHCYKDRGDFNPETMCARWALENSGWQNASLRISPSTDITMSGYKKSFAQQAIKFIVSKEPSHRSLASFEIVREVPIVRKVSGNIIFALSSFNEFYRSITYRREKEFKKKEAENKKALIQAVLKRDIQMILDLIKKGVNLNIKNKGAPILISAINKHHKRVAVTLIKYGADVKVKNKTGVTPLIAAIKIADKDITLALIKHGADLNAADNKGKTVLKYAAHSSKEITKMISDKINEMKAQKQRIHALKRSLLSELISQNKLRTTASPGKDDEISDPICRSIHIK